MSRANLKQIASFSRQRVRLPQMGRQTDMQTDHLNTKLHARTANVFAKCEIDSFIFPTMKMLTVDSQADRWNLSLINVFRILSVASVLTM